MNTFLFFLLDLILTIQTAAIIGFGLVNMDFQNKSFALNEQTFAMYTRMTGEVTDVE